MPQVFRAETEQHYAEARVLFAEYASSLDFDLEFQGFEEELATFPAQYSPPEGCLLLARQGRRVVGCVALRKLEQDTCEMKRLYVRPGAQGRGVGRALVRTLIDEARRLGYGRMRLDTVPSMHAARALYTSVGFRPIEPYRHNPIEGATFMELLIE